MHLVQKQMVAGSGLATFALLSVLLVRLGDLFLNRLVEFELIGQLFGFWEFGLDGFDPVALSVFAVLECLVGGWEEVAQKSGVEDFFVADEAVEEVFDYAFGELALVDFEDLREGGYCWLLWFFVWWGIGEED